MSSNNCNILLTIFLYSLKLQNKSLNTFTSSNICYSFDVVLKRINRANTFNRKWILKFRIVISIPSKKYPTKLFTKRTSV
ncbi:hypothetical protein BpHYR1_052852 [Brachionus plicatilis]|uniref:Uncharacterized protein n=1 Tax=Brachionus plicatilis TaxID=10195 RepID=A0A3M7RIM9_BRAPC|nr:hypothetical protein BpHYR1_052852 [Brachionus plicatilis]